MRTAHQGCGKQAPTYVGRSDSAVISEAPDLDHTILRGAGAARGRHEPKHGYAVDPAQERAKASARSGPGTTVADPPKRHVCRGVLVAETAGEHRRNGASGRPRFADACDVDIALLG